MYDFEAVAVDDAAASPHAALLSQAFPHSTLFTPQYIHWQYALNPAGPIVGFDALDRSSGELAAHYVCQPFEAELRGERLRGLLSLNTATHPRHQGRGLFTQLASRTYEHAKARGFDFVIGVANANSTHGFVRKLGFQLVTQLHAMLGLGPLRFSGDREPSGFRRIWNEAALHWRLANPQASYTVRDGAIWASSGKPLTDALIGHFPSLADSGNRGAAPLHLWIGCDPRVRPSRNRGYVDLPQRLRPSPLNLIYKDLRDPSRVLDPRDVQFWAIDFDAY